MKPNKEKDKPLGQLPPVIKNKIALETIKIVTEGKYINSNNKTVDIKEQIDKANKGSILYKPNHIYNISDFSQSNSLSSDNIVEVTQEYSLEACQRLYSMKILNPSCLSFASARNPGGGFCGMNEAQEENLCRSSSLYWTLINHLDMYKFNRKNSSLLYSDYIIYSPNVPVFRDTKYNLLNEPYFISFISSPAVNCSMKNLEVNDIKKVMYERIKKIIRVAVINGSRGIVLGAFGCGVFKNNTKDVADYFYRVIYKEGYIKYFDKIIFAVPGNKNDDFKILLNK